MTAMERTKLIFSICEHELKPVDPNNLEVLKAAIYYHIKEAEDDVRNSFEQKKTLPQEQLKLKNYNKKQRH